jgi:N-acetylglucosamine malate deacetylase 1
MIKLVDLLTNRNIIIVGAHADDEVLGVGGTIQRAKKLGSTVSVLIITDSVSEQYQHDQSQIEKRNLSLRKCCDKLGVDKTIQLNFPDMRLDEVSHIELNKALYDVINNNFYDTVFVHHPGDINLDHRVVFESVMVACRPLPECHVKNLLTYYTHSSTEWGNASTGRLFEPNIFVDITNELPSKLEAFSFYEDEIRKFPHPRSLENISNTAKYYGSSVGLEACEMFKLIRSKI